MKKALRLFILIFFLTIISAAAYYTITIIKARRKTPALISGILKSGKIQIKLSDLPDGWLEILLKVEDPCFYEHNGIDLVTPGAGLTTITQGMVKYLYFENFKPGIDKIRQSLIAVFALDALVPKNQQLLIFINTAYMGESNNRSIRGFQEAADEYFQKPFSKLSEDEYLALVAMIIAPNSFHVKRYPERNRKRVCRIRKMLAGTYTPRELMDLYYDK